MSDTNGADMYTVGIDIGSSATKGVLLEDGKQIKASIVIPFGTGTSGVSKVLEGLEQKCPKEMIEANRIVATGYGRRTYKEAYRQVSELTCHAKGVHFIMPEARTVIDVGGQDVKILRIKENGQLGEFVMNEKCAAGTGRFLEVMARVLETTVDQLGSLDMQATEIANISSTCTVFAESEVISKLSTNVPIPNIVAGIHASVARRTAGLARRLGIEEKVAMSGGVAQNGGIVRALERELNTTVYVVENPQIAGALGAAIIAYEDSKK